MDIREVIKSQLSSTKIQVAQLDPNGLCNAKCWFCPVKYQGNPEEFVNQLPLEDLDVILTKVRAATVVDQQKFNFLYTAHYNEVLLYKHFEGMLELFRKHKLTTMVLSNGTPLTPDKTDIIMKNKDVVPSVCLNIPDLDPAQWAKKAGFGLKLHDILLKNLDYLHKHATELYVSVGINCLTETTRDILPSGVFTLKSELEKIKEDFKARYPSFKVFSNEGLVDRGGMLEEANVIKNTHAIMPPGKKVVGCNHSSNTGSRPYGWLHVNSKGDLFLCCDDYKMEYKFGNLLESPSLDELWFSDAHVDAIERSFSQLCKSCIHHKLG